MVEQSNKHTEQHVDYAEDDRYLHLVRVLEDDLVQRCHLPDRIEPERVRRLGVIHALRIQLQCLVGHHGRGVVVGPPGRSEHVQRFREDVIVHEARVHRKHAHQEDNVPATKEDVPDFVVRFLRRQRLLLQHHPQPEQGHDRTVPKIAEHDREQEREGNDRVRGWVHFAIARDTVRIDQRLERVRKFVRPVVRRRILERFHPVQDRWHGRSGPLRTAAQRDLNRLEVQQRHPALRDQTLLRHVQIEQVQRVVDRFDLAHLHEPILQVLGSRHQHPVPMVLRLAEHRVQILDARHHAHRHLAPIGRGLRAGVERRPEPFADLLHARLQLVALEEDDEHRLVHLVALQNTTANAISMCALLAPGRHPLLTFDGSSSGSSIIA